MMNLVPILAVLAAPVLLTDCNEKSVIIEPATERVADHIGAALPYDLDAPVYNVSLSRDLKEISGLTYSTASNHLLSINDEKGYIYKLDPANGKIVDRIHFGKSSDYEGIAYHSGDIYVVESNGNITAVDEASKKRKTKFKTKLSRKNDIEGIAFNALDTSLLLCAKAQGSIKKKSGKKKSIFKLDPMTEKIDENPVIHVDLSQASKSIAIDTQISNYQNLRIGKFSPSGIAIHPESQDIYVLSSRGKLLVVFDQKGGLKGVHFLKEEQHAQPEGICFGPDNTLYISNEGRAGKASLKSYSFLK